MFLAQTYSPESVGWSIENVATYAVCVSVKGEVPMKGYSARGGRTATRADIENIFEAYLPTYSCGYIRILPETCSDHEFYEQGWYGFFDASGDLKATSNSLLYLKTQANKEGYVVLPIQ